MADYMDANSSSEKPKWMQDPSLKGISMEKLDFLQKMVFESSSLSQKELMPFLMALAQKKPDSEHYFYPGGNDRHH